MCFLRANVYFPQQSYLSVAQSGIGVCRFGRFNLRVHQLLEGASYGGLWAELQAHYHTCGKRFSIRQAAKHSCTLQLAPGSTHRQERGEGNQGKGFSRKPPQFVSQAVAGVTCHKVETTLKYEKGFWEDGITHKENLIFGVHLTLRLCCI